MKTTLCIFTKSNSKLRLEESASDETLGSLTVGKELKFTIQIALDMRDGTPCFYLCLGDKNTEHSKIDGVCETHLNVHHENECKVLIEEGGGYVKIEDNKLIFFDSSSTFGKYNPGYLRLVENDFKRMFRVTTVEYQ